MKNKLKLSAALAISMLVISCSNSNDLTQANLEGIWDATKVTQCNLQNDNEIASGTLTQGSLYFTFQGNSFQMEGSYVENDSSESEVATYTIDTWNGYDVIIFSSSTETDTILVEDFNPPTMKFNFKRMIMKDPEQTFYVKFDLQKRD